MKIQLDIPKELNKKLKIHRIKEDLPSIKESIISILEEYFLVGGQK